MPSLHQAGKLRILAFCHSRRAAIAPEIPTMIEAGVPGYEAYTFSLVLGPAGLPRNVIDTLDKASRQAMAAHDVRLPDRARPRALMIHERAGARGPRFAAYFPTSGSIFLAALMSSSAPALSPSCSLATPRPYKAAAKPGSSLSA